MLCAGVPGSLVGEKVPSPRSPERLMTVQILLAVAGLVVLTLAADHLVLGSSRIATRLRISPVVVGVVVIGLGTSAPEFLVSGVAAARGDTGIALGNITGSNILNLTLILGIAALIARLAVASSVIRREVPLAVAAVIMFGLVALIGLNMWAGIVLTAGAVAAIWLLLRWAAQGRNAELASEVAEYTEYTDQPLDGVEEPAAAAPAKARFALPAWFEPIRAVLGLAGVLAGAQLLVANASTIAANLGVPQLVVGFTVVALGTSLPELVTTIQAMRRQESDLVVGNLFGSNLFNSLAGGAVIAFAAPSSSTGTIGVALTLTMILTGGIAWTLLRRGLALTRVEGGILLALYVLTIPLLLAG
jgi:cation:H+ antiporter